MGNAEQLTRAEIKRRIQSGPVTATETWYAREALLLAERDTAHARIAELEDRVQKLETCVLTLLPWAEDHEAELAPFEVKMLERARAVEKGK